jgi:hypothetical protein
MITIIIKGKAYKATLKEDKTGFAINVFAPNENTPIFGTRFGLKASFEKQIMDWVKKKCEIHSKENTKPCEQEAKTVWDFVEKYYPNYSGCNTIAKFNDLEAKSEVKKLNSTEMHELRVLEAAIYNEAIKAYLAETAGKNEGTGKENKQFPNGFDSWQETHFEIVKAIANTPEDAGNKVTNTECMKGRGGLYELAEELTSKFEKLHKGKQWDGEFFDAIEEFLEQEFSND